MKSIFGKLEDKVKMGRECNLLCDNFDDYFKIWIRNLCLVIDEEIEDLKERINKIEFKE